MNSQRITSIETATATGSNRKYFDMLQSALGMVPNMTQAMAQSPAVLEGYVSLNGALTKSSIGAKLSEEIALTLAGANHCDYCASAHTVLGKHAGLTQNQVTSALQGTAEEVKTAAALKFAKVLVEKRGQVSDSDVEAVKNAGYSEGQVGEIVAAVALNTFTNYFNNVAMTEIDFPKVSV